MLRVIKYIFTKSRKYSHTLFYTPLHYLGFYISYGYWRLVIQFFMWLNIIIQIITPGGLLISTTLTTYKYMKYKYEIKQLQNKIHNVNLQLKYLYHPDVIKEMQLKYYCKIPQDSYAIFKTKPKKKKK